MGVEQVRKLQVVQAVNPRKLHADLKKALGAATTSTWDVARLIEEICRRESWRQIGYASRSAWVETELRGHYSPGAVSRICEVVRKVDALDLRARKPFVEVPFWTAVEALRVEIPVAAEVLAEGGSQHDVRRRVNERLKEAGRDDEVEAEAFRTVELRLPEVLAGKFDALCNAGRFELGAATPSMIVLVEWIVTQGLHEWRRDSDAAAWKRLDVAESDILRGRVKCEKCGSWEAGALRRVSDEKFGCGSCFPA